MDPENGVLVCELSNGNTARGEHYAVPVLARQLHEQAVRESLGPNPKEMLRQLLVERGRSAEEAEARAKGRAWHTADGTVVARTGACGVDVTDMPRTPDVPCGEPSLRIAADIIAREYEADQRAASAKATRPCTPDAGSAGLSVAAPCRYSF